MSQVLNPTSQAGSQKSDEPRLLSEILKEYFENSNEPLAKGYRKFLADKMAGCPKGHAELFHGLYPNTELCIDLKTYTRRPGRMEPLDLHYGTLVRDVEEDRFIFAETARGPKADERNPHLYEGENLTVTLRKDGSLRVNLRDAHIVKGFPVEAYADAVRNEICQALTGLLIKEDLPA